MIIKLQYDGGKMGRILFPKETKDRLSLKEGYSIWFYKNEHGFFFKPVYPNTSQLEPKDSIKCTIIQYGANVNDTAINSRKVGMQLMEYFISKNGIQDTGGGIVIDVLDTNKADVFRLNFIEQLERKVKVNLNSFKDALTNDDREKSSLEANDGEKDEEVQTHHFGGKRKVITITPSPVFERKESSAILGTHQNFKKETLDISIISSDIINLLDWTKDDMSKASKRFQGLDHRNEFAAHWNNSMGGGSLPPANVVPDEQKVFILDDAIKALETNLNRLKELKNKIS